MKTIIKIGNTYEAEFLSEIEGDAPNFIRNCEKIIQNRISHWCPKELFIVSLNTTFGSASIEHKESSSDMFSFWSYDDKLEVTRYHPDIYNPSTTIYLSSYKGYEEKTDASYIKKRKREEYSTFKTAYGAKVHNYKPIDDGLIIHYTKNTLSRDEGSIMFFYRSYTEYDAILVTLSKNNNWNISDTYGISISEMQQALND